MVRPPLDECPLHLQVESEPGAREWGFGKLTQGECTVKPEPRNVDAYLIGAQETQVLIIISYLFHRHLKSLSTAMKIHRFKTTCTKN